MLYIEAVLQQMIIIVFLLYLTSKHQARGRLGRNKKYQKIPRSIVIEKLDNFTTYSTDNSEMSPYISQSIFLFSQASSDTAVYVILRVLMLHLRIIDKLKVKCFTVPN